MGSFRDFIARRKRKRIGPSHQPQQDQTPNTTCFILELPVELVTYLSSFLNTSSCMLFSHTCSAIYKILNTEPTNIYHKNDPRYTRWEYINYLSLLSRDLPDYWVCEACNTLHIVDERDVPSEPVNFTCPLGLNRWRTVVYNDQTRIDSRFLTLHHRHIQLALKYTRMKDPKYDTYLRALLKPYHVSHFPSRMDAFWSPLDSTFSSLFKATYSAYPKIVSDPDGKLRFLLLSTWVYNANQNIAISHIALGELAICPHTRFRSERNIYYIRTRGPALENALDGATGRIRQYQYRDIETSTGSCSRCPTDFTLRVTTHYVEIQAWQDMGTEGSPRDLSWTIHAMGFIRGDSRDYLSASIPHIPGSIRERFNVTQDSKLEHPRTQERITNPIYRFWASLFTEAPPVIDTSVGRPVDNFER